MPPEDREPEVKVTDRRRFTAEGEPLDTAEEETPSPPPEPAPESVPLPPPTFEFLVLSLRWQAEAQLGLYDAAPQGQHPPDLAGARHSIDLLAMLQEKTRGNLTLEQQRLLDNSVTELRFRYVQAVEKHATKT